MKAIKIIVLILTLLAISNNIHGAVYIVVNQGPEPITVNIEIVKVPFFRNVVGTLTAEVQPGKPTQNGLDTQGGGKTASAIYLTKVDKNGKPYRLPLANSNVSSGDIREILSDAGGISKDMTFVFTMDNGVWSVRYFVSHA